MITRLRVCNFKSHKDTELQMKPLTLITGVNNCGKSTLIQALLLLRQSYGKNRLEKGLDLNKPLVSIGTANDALRRGSESGIVSFEIDDSKEGDLKFRFNAEEDLDLTYIPTENVTLRGESLPFALMNNWSLFNNDFHYLSAERWGGRSEFPKDSYAVKTEGQLSSEYGRGELLGNFLYEHKAKDVCDYFHGGEEKMSLIEQVVLWEGRISQNITIDVQQKDDGNGYVVLYGTKGSEGKKNIDGLRANNVGFGVSYSLPIVVALLSAEPGALILVENPEAHLHPEGIAELTRLMCLAAERGVQVVVETHSDHVVNGVLVNCKRMENGEAGINKENVAIYYLAGQDDDHVAMVEEVKIVEGGYIEYQPKGFFDRIEKDMFELYPEPTINKEG